MNFTVLIESSKTFPEQDWEAVLWHNGNEDREWCALPLEELPSGRVIGPVSRLAFSYDFETQSTLACCQLERSSKRLPPVLYKWTAETEGTGLYPIYSKVSDFRQSVMEMGE